ncbi:related to Mitochondrial intermembrane space cysteine motif-containing protein MIC14 [Zygosaccharomyces bailii]|nr:related to Mitochondrial intermembrane space cysteine motif-containing protein MIC14 [Zygosaccharomyces bailii ISA1307]SJM83291.1 related to Mitochondrial intermembrane space cysteine motif-containing protein MIC14 [Zygosaccharomyces bailii]
MSQLDQFIMEDVAANCPREFVAYHKCVSSNRDDPSQCAFRQKDLSQCIKGKVPSVQRVMDNCGSLMHNYETCVRNNMASGTINEQCTGLLEQMRSCASQHAMKGPRPINEMIRD